MKKLPKYSNEPNFFGYPLWYVVDEYKCQCNECATLSKSDGISIQKEVNWDDTNLWCDECCEKIESAYGEDVEDEEEHLRRDEKNGLYPGKWDYSN